LLRPWDDLPRAGVPKRGWIRAIRQALGMSGGQLGRRLGLTRQGVEDLERREAARSVTLAALAEAARALDAELVYAIVPRTSLEEARRARARAVAERELGRVAHSMRLEAQGVSKAEHNRQVTELQNELLRAWSRRIWDELPGEVPETPPPRRSP
jgi:predicted DNA-binding mobile mystery protein A